MHNPIHTRWLAPIFASAVLILYVASFGGFVFSHDFGPGVLPSQGSNGYFLITEVLRSGWLSFLVMLSVGFIYLLLLSQVMIRSLSWVGAVIILVSGTCLAILINWTGTNRGLYEFGAFFRTSTNDYSVELMFGFSWVFVLVGLTAVTCISLVLGVILRVSRT